MNDPIIGTFHNAETGETIVRELTEEERAAIPEMAAPLPSGEPFTDPE